MMSIARTLAPLDASPAALEQLKKAFPTFEIEGNRFVLNGRRFGLKSVGGRAWHGEEAPVGHYLIPNPDDYSHADWFSHICDEESLNRYLKSNRRPRGFWATLFSPFNPLDHEQTK